MKLATLFLLVCWQLAAQSPYEIFSSEKSQGVKSQQGQILIPPIYDAVGWSNQTHDVVNGLIGYRVNGKWGLINLSNKKITEPKFDKIEPFMPGKFLIAMKVNFTNQFFYGLINQRGKTILSIDYSKLLYQSGVILAGVHENNQLLMGVLKSDFSTGVGISYREIEIFDHLLIGQKPSNEIDVFTKAGQLIEENLHEVRKDGNFFITTKNGRYGLLSSEGEVVYLPIYKKIKSFGRITSFPQMEIRTKSEILTISGDSVDYIGDDLWIYHSNGVSLFYSTLAEVPQGSIALKQLTNGISVVQSTTTGEWLAYNSKGSLVLKASDSIYFDGKYLYSHDGREWSIHSRSGTRLSDKGFDSVIPQQGHYLPVNKFNYWAVLNAIDQSLSDFRYDSISQVIGSKIIVKYIGEWGVFHQGHGWLIQPKFDKIYFENGQFLAERNRKNYLFSQIGQLVFKTFDAIKPQANHFILTSKGKFSVLNEKGRPVGKTIYRSVKKWGDLYELNLEFVDLVTSNGRKILDQKDQIQDIVDYSGGLFLIKKNNHFGLVDTNIKLRIANRYDSAKGFSESLAAVKLRGKWGFIDRSEKLVIQPHYQWVGFFNNGLVIVKSNGYYGLLDTKGREVLATVYLSIELTDAGNYVMKSKNGTHAIANKEGITFLSGIYEYLEDVGNSTIIGTLSGKQGVMNYHGQTLINFEYDEIEIEESYMLLLKEEG